MHQCPCGLQNAYEQCCGLYIENKQIPQTPEQLMRSRYTAYSLANIDYIKNTMQGKALIGFHEANALQWAQQVTWLGLEVINANPTHSDIGFVEFTARLLEHNKVQTIHEVSEFHREHNRWFYVSGITKEVLPKKTKPQVARNSPCPCGSGKKFKNCHAKQ